GVSARRLDASFTPYGDKFRVNSIAEGDQENAHAAMLNNGGAVIAWEGGKPGFHNVYARFLRGDGTFTGEDILVNTPSQIGNFRQSVTWTLFHNNKAKVKTQRVALKLRNVTDYCAGPAVAVL